MQAPPTSQSYASFLPPRSVGRAIIQERRDPLTYPILCLPAHCSEDFHMSQIHNVPIPEVFILWHPHCSLGEALARQVILWLRPGNGLGPEVFYRSFPAPEAQPAGLPPALPGEHRESVERTTRQRVTNLQLVLALVDENMVADPAWRYWIDQIVQQRSAVNRVVWPIAHDSSAYNMPASVKQMN
jgi:hypothetical protein